MPGSLDHVPGRETPSAREDARLAGLLDPGVQSVDLMLTTSCNFRCAYCDQERGASRQMSGAVLDAAIGRLVSSRLDRPRLTLFGGEPLLAVPLVRRALERVREWAPRRMKPDVRIFTNGSRLDEAMTRLLVSRRVFITISSDGVDRAQDARSPGSFAVLDHLLIRLRRDHPQHFLKRVGVLTTLTSRNVPFLSESFRYFLSRFVRDLRVAPVLPDDAGWCARAARELDRQLAIVVGLSIEEFRRSGEIPFRPFRSAPSRPGAGGTPVCACGSRGLLFVDVDGTLAPCSTFASSTFGARPEPLRRVLAALGGLHVADEDLPARLAAREARARRLRFLSAPRDRQGSRSDCARCNARAACFVCPEAVACNGGRVPAFHCDVNRLFARHRAAFQREAGLTPTRSCRGASTSRRRRRG